MMHKITFQLNYYAKFEFQIASSSVFKYQMASTLARWEQALLSREDKMPGKPAVNGILTVVPTLTDATLSSR